MAKCCFKTPPEDSVSCPKCWPCHPTNTQRTSSPTSKINSQLGSEHSGHQVRDAQRIHSSVQFHSYCGTQLWQQLDAAKAADAANARTMKGSVFRTSKADTSVSARAHGSRSVRCRRRPMCRPTPPPTGLDVFLDVLDA